MSGLIKLTRKQVVDRVHQRHDLRGRRLARYDLSRADLQQANLSESAIFNCFKPNHCTMPRCPMEPCARTVRRRPE